MEDIKIGIGLLTYQRPECKKLFLEQVKKFPPHYNYQLHVEENNPSISNGKNKNLYALRNCDYIFLFDDDTFPIKKDWDLPFINAGEHHLLYMDERHGFICTDGVVSGYKDCSGCFMFMTKEVFNKVGYFNTAYKLNGMEHVGYSTRINKAQRENMFVCLNETKDYIYALDLQSEKDWKVWHKTTITPEQKSIAINGNRPVLMEEINGEKLYYDRA